MLFYVVCQSTNISLPLYIGPPPNNCIATINGKKILKKMDELWLTEDVCVKAQCAFDTNGNPLIKTQREDCNVICQAVGSLKLSKFNLKLFFLLF